MDAATWAGGMTEAIRFGGTIDLKIASRNNPDVYLGFTKPFTQSYEYDQRQSQFLSHIKLMENSSETVSGTESDMILVHYTKSTDTLSYAVNTFTFVGSITDPDAVPEEPEESEEGDGSDEADDMATNVAFSAAAITVVLGALHF